MKQLLLALLACLTVTSYSQVNVDYTVSDKVKDTKFTGLTASALTHDGQRIMIIKNLPKLVGKNRQKVQMLDQGMNILEDREIQDLKIIDIISMKEKSFFLYEDENGSLNMREIDESDFKGTGEVFKILQMEQLKGGVSFGKRPYVKPDYTVSEDSTKLAFLLIDKVKKKDRQTFATAVYDQNIKKGYGKSFNVGLTDKEYAYKGFKVGNDGAIYLSGVELTKDRIIFGDSYDQVLINRIFVDEKSKYSVNLDEKDKWVGEIEIINGDQSKGIDLLAFMYENKIGLSEVMIAKLDENLDIKTTNRSEVRFKDFIVDDNDKEKDKAKEKKKKKSAKEQRGLKIRKIAKLGDGRQLVISEIYYVAVSSNYNPQTGVTSYSYTYHYNDIVALMFEESGELKWAKKIAKRQSSANPTTFGVAIYQDEENVRLLFNDDEKNADPERKKLFRYRGEFKKGICKVVEIDLNTGETKEDVVFNLKDEGMYIEPRNYFEMDDGSLIVMGFKRKDRSIVKLTFPK